LYILYVGRQDLTISYRGGNLATKEPACRQAGDLTEGIPQRAGEYTSVVAGSNYPSTHVSISEPLSKNACQKLVSQLT